MTAPRPRVLRRAAVRGRKGAARTAVATALLGLAACDRTAIGTSGERADADARPVVRSPGTAAASAWEPLPIVPGTTSSQLDGAAMRAIGGRIHVAAVIRRRTASTVTLRRLDGPLWRSLGRAVVDRDSRVEIVDDRGAPCVAAARRERLTLWCLRAGRWQISEGPRGSFSAADPSASAPIVATTVLERRSGIGERPRLRVTVAQRRARGWSAPWGELAPRSPAGAQRPFLVRHRGRLCAWHDALPADPGTRPHPTLSCATSTRWRVAAPALPPQPRGVVASAAGAIVAGGVLYVGVLRHLGPAVDWQVLRLARGDWHATSLAAADPRWNEQGQLHAIAGAPWAVQFDQRPDAGALRTRVRVRSLDRRGGADVGAPLRIDSPMTTPLYYGLAETRAGVYAMATVPSGHGPDMVQVLRLRPPGG